MKLFKPEAKKREMVSIEPTAFFALQDLIKKYGTDLKGLDGKNIDVYFPGDGYEYGEYFYHHMDSGVLKKGCFEDDIKRSTVSMKPETYSKLRDILEKHGNFAQWLSSLEGKNINVYFPSDGYESPEDYYYHIEGGVIKPGTFEGELSQNPWSSEYIKEGVSTCF